MQSLGKIEQRAPAVGAKIWRLLYFCHAPRPVHSLFDGVYFEQVLCRCLWVDFDAIFSVFFRRARKFSFLLLGGVTIFGKLRSKIV